jgi:hypothetical protein
MKSIAYFHNIFVRKIINFHIILQKSVKFVLKNRYIVVLR